MNPHSLLDDDATTPTMEPGRDIFGDEHEVDDFDGIADGFRPDHGRGMLHEEAVGAEEPWRVRMDQQRVAIGDHIDEDVTVRTVSAHYSPTPVTPTAPSRNSMRKPRNYADSSDPFASPEDRNHENDNDDDDDDDDALDHEEETMQFEPDADGMRRSMSTVSSRMFARTHSPRFGTSGPSHPYTMYQQATMPRSPSSATASSIRPSDRRSPPLRHGPQHPYSMYPQAVDEDLDDEDAEEHALRQNPVPVGFPGLGQRYTRRMGPDGEEQDMIGADGHTEQLPPYSRYPEDGPEKVPLLMPTALHSRAPVAGTDPGMPLMHTILQPSTTPQSMMDASQRTNRPGSMASIERYTSESDGASRSKSRPWKDAPWKEKAKIKFCGIPFWCYILALAVISFIAAVLGIAIGGFVANRSHTSSSSGQTVTLTTSLFDASLIASPTSQNPPTGTFALTLGPAQQTQAQCLVEQSQQVAWDCNIAPNAEIAINVGTGPGTTQSGANIFYAADISIAYGSQASYMNTTFSTFLTVRDTDDMSAGPAFYFTALYDKVVVVPEHAFDPMTQRFRPRNQAGLEKPSLGWYLNEAWRLETELAQAGDKPWFCVWNATLLEGFIYIDQTSNWTATPTGPYPNTEPTITPLATSQPMNITGLPSSTAPLTSSPSTSSSLLAQTTSMTTPTPTSYPGQGNTDDDDNGNNSPPYKRQAGPSDTQVAWSTLPVYPYMIKLEERRLPNNNVQAYCQQYQILDDGTANWVGGGPNQNQPIIINLQEQDPPFSAYESAGIGEVSRKLRARAANGGSDTVANGCHCQWISGGQMTGGSG